MRWLGPSLATLLAISDPAILIPTPLQPPSTTSAARQYIAHCEAARGFTVVTVNTRDALVFGCVKFGIERVPIDEDPE